MTDWEWQGPERRAYTRREWVSATAGVLITPLAETAAAHRSRCAPADGRPLPSR